MSIVPTLNCYFKAWSVKGMSKWTLVEYHMSTKMVLSVFNSKNTF